MDEKQLQALANELAKNRKTPEDLNQFDRLLKKISPGPAPMPVMASRNHRRWTTGAAYSARSLWFLRTTTDEKNQTRITGMDNQILSLYAKDMTTREIAAAFKGVRLENGKYPTLSLFFVQTTIH